MYDTLTELIEKIYLGEDATIEFKKELPHRNSLADEIAAFANARGGVILIGVDDNGEIVGVNLQELTRAEKTVVETCADSIDPLVPIFTEKLRIDDKNVLKIEVPRSLFVHESPNGYFTRHGSSKRKMPTDQLARLFQTRSQARIIAFDEQFVPNTDKDTLRKELYQRFITEGATEDEIEDLLLKRRLLVKAGDQNRASVAGVLMCNDNPDDYLYNSFIQAVFYLSNKKDANYQLDAKDFKGPLDQQIINTMKFVERYNAVAARKDIGRIDYPEYSMRAVFEAIVNAVVHRDYSKKTVSKIRLFMFSDRLELYSPGALANTVTVDNLRYSQATRNELLARLLSEITLDDDMRKQVARRYFLERRGEGVGIILNESETLSNKTPVYELFDEELRLTIFAAKSS
ncbi:MAG: putative DNA binding domain-containing protein [Candidatus Poribacteria bacterium]|nr:putative DNA binding domain-containing protein [Candidatus Poribacteria bacterium]